MVEKYREKRKELYVAFMDLKEAYDIVCREAPWRVLHGCGVDGYLIRSMSSLYNGSRVCARVGSRVEEYFGVMRGVETGVCNVPVALNIFFLTKW